ncbi:MAG: cyanophycin synthetase, partial [Bacillota bacterium]
GIIKSRNKVVTAAVLPEVLKIIQATAEEKQAELMVFGQQFTIQILSADLNGVSFNYVGASNNYLALKTPLLGEHQGVNAATAVAVMECLAFLGYSISEQAIREGLAKVTWLGRLEVLQTKPTILIDAAHNVDGALTLKKALRDLFTYQRLVLILGMLADKEREKVLAILAPLADVLILTKPNSPRAGDWEVLGDLARSYVQDLKIIPDIQQAINEGLLSTSKEDLFCVTGSIYMISEARKLLLKDY